MGVSDYSDQQLGGRSLLPGTVVLAIQPPHIHMHRCSDTICVLFRGFQDNTVPRPYQVTIAPFNSHLSPCPASLPPASPVQAPPLSLSSNVCRAQGFTGHTAEEGGGASRKVREGNSVLLEVPWVSLGTLWKVDPPTYKHTGL